MKLKWTFERIQEESLKFQTRIEFKNNSSSAYSSARKNGWLDLVCNHMKLLKNRTYTVEDLRGIAEKYNRRVDFQNQNSSAYGAALNKGILDDICAHMTPSSTKPYTIEEIKEEALKFNTKKSFQLGSPAYKAAWRRGVLNEVCAHMPQHVDQSGENNPSFKWKKEDIHREALKFFSRSDFKFGSPKLYDVAVQRGIIDEICSHMKKSRNVSKPELELFNIIKEKCPSITTYRKRDVKIEGKPYIKGFYLDILVGNKGIEFDGDWHHSFEGLKRSRAKRGWSDEDILNYHKYKDEHFKLKGIDVLHIKWKDWMLDRESCISKCFKFLFSQS